MITPQQFRNPQVKPKWQLPAGVMGSVVAYNCRKYGFPIPILAMPMWEGAGNRALDYSGHGNHGNVGANCNWDALGMKTVGATNGVVIPSLTGSGDGSWPVNQEFTIVQTLNGAGVSDGDWSCSMYSEILVAKSSGKVEFIVNDLGTVDRISSVSDFPSSVFNLATTYQNTPEMKIYINGKLETTSSGSTGSYSISGRTFNILGSSVGTSYNYTNVISNTYIFFKTLSATQVKFLDENPYFMYEIPEELYGYTAAVGDTATNLLHGKIIIKDSSIILVDGLIKVQETVADLFDGELKVIEKVTSLADGKLQVQDIDTDLADGKLQVKDSTTSLADGKVQIQDIDTDFDKSVCKSCG